MPELPEVEAARQLAEDHCRGKIITKVTAHGEDTKVIEGIQPCDLEVAVQGRTLVAANRKGMTGSIVVHGVKSVQYKSFVVGEDWPPRFCKLELQFEGGGKLAFSDARRFGRVRLQLDPANHPPVSKLGFDPLLGMPTLEEFRGLMAKQRRMLKVVIMDQAFLAGVGNWVADEVLYQARLHPEAPAKLLTEGEVERLHSALHSVPKTAVDACADSSRFPKDWLFHHRWSKKKAGGSVGGRAIEIITVGGRTTAYVPEVQKMSEQAAAGNSLHLC
eukprot:jgi/Astpho2/7791/fgenesh1_pm.00117_%23_8_t